MLDQKKKKISPVARGVIAWQVTKKPKKRSFLKCSQNFKQKSKLSDSASFRFSVSTSQNNRLALMLDTKAHKAVRIQINSWELL